MQHSLRVSCLSCTPRGNGRLNYFYHNHIYFLDIINLLVNTCCTLIPFHLTTEKILNSLKVFPLTNHILTTFIKNDKTIQQNS